MYKVFEMSEYGFRKCVAVTKDLYNAINTAYYYADVKSDELMEIPKRDGESYKWKTENGTVWVWIEDEEKTDES